MRLASATVHRLTLGGTAFAALHAAPEVLVTRPPLRHRPGRAPIAQPDIIARLASAVLGVWLILSTFVWEHFPTARLNTIVSGALIAASAIAALRISVLRRVTMALSAWLFTVSLLAPRPLHLATLWNDLLVAATVFALTLITPGHEQAPLSARRGRGDG
jgi:hypothetical protein